MYLTVDQVLLKQWKIWECAVYIILQILPYLQSPLNTNLVLNSNLFTSLLDFLLNLEQSSITFKYLNYD